jgi:hypothetical protein
LSSKYPGGHIQEPLDPIYEIDLNAVELQDEQFEEVTEHYKHE